MIKIIIKIGILCVFINFNFIKSFAQSTLLNSRLTTTVQMQNYLDVRINKSAKRKTLVSSNKQIVDCIDINLQPAMQNPLLQGHRIASIPNDKRPSSQNSIVENNTLFEQLPNGNLGKAASCPSGTVPILSISQEQLNRFASLDRFFSKSPDGQDNLPLRNSLLNISVPNEPPPPSSDHIGSTAYHQYATAYAAAQNYGGFASFSIYYNEIGAFRDEFSLSQIWITGGSGAQLQTVEAGIQKYPLLYPDWGTHLFIYSTRGNYASGTGCYNGTCGDFVQLSSKIFPGMILNSLSTIGSIPVEIKIDWSFDRGNWWLVVDDVYVGYYPSALFSDIGLKKGATSIVVGGEILNKPTVDEKGHTTTTMGSGRFSSEGYKKAAYARKIKFYNFVDNPETGPVYRTSTDLKGLILNVTDSYCYDAKLLYSADPNFSTTIYFGGPGRSVINRVFNCM